MGFKVGEVYQVLNYEDTGLIIGRHHTVRSIGNGGDTCSLGGYGGNYEWVELGYLELLGGKIMKKEIKVGDKVVYDVLTHTDQDGHGVTEEMENLAGKEWTVCEASDRICRLKYGVHDFMFARADLRHDPSSDITSLYTTNTRGEYSVGDSEVRWAKKRRNGERQLIIKYGGGGNTCACIKEKDIPKLAAALLEFM